MNSRHSGDKPQRAHKQDETMNEERISFDEFWENVQNENKGQLVDLWNEYKEHENDYDGKIYRMDELDDLLQGKEPSEVIRMSFYGYDQNTEREYLARSSDYYSSRLPFNPNQPFVRFNGYGNLVSMSNVEIFGSKIYDARTYLDKSDAMALYEWLIETDQI